MKVHVTTLIFDIAVLLALAAVTFGLWFYPWLVLIVLALLLLGGCLSDGKKRRSNRTNPRLS